MNKVKTKIPPPRLVLHGENIVKVSGETDSTFVGYDIFTEKLFSLPKESTIDLPKVFFDIMSHEDFRVRMAMAVCTKRVEASKLLNVTERTIYRMMDKFEIRKGNSGPKLRVKQKNETIL